MANSASAKGNPASHRMSNSKNQLVRARCWERGQKRKDEIKVEVKAAEQKNKKLKAAGIPTAWEFAKQLRSVKRSEATGAIPKGYSEGVKRKHEAKVLEVLGS